MYLRNDRAASTQLPQIEQLFNGLLAELPVIFENFVGLIITTSTWGLVKPQGVVLQLCIYNSYRMAPNFCCANFL